MTSRAALLLSAEEDAAALLAAVGGPVPVDPFALARSLGLATRSVPLPSDVCGRIVRRPRTGATLLVNRADTLARQRFTCAHQLGHYRSCTASGAATFEFVDFRSTLAAGSCDLEVWANQFAAALLMPAPLVRSCSAAGLDAAALARVLGTSEPAARSRLRNLRLL